MGERGACISCIYNHELPLRPLDDLVEAHAIDSSQSHARSIRCKGEIARQSRRESRRRISDVRENIHLIPFRLELWALFLLLWYRIGAWFTVNCNAVRCFVDTTARPKQNQPTGGLDSSTLTADKVEASCSSKHPLIPCPLYSAWQIERHDERKHKQTANLPTHPAPRQRDIQHAFPARLCI